jgi:predicted metal-dependent hydrolase
MSLFARAPADGDRLEVGGAPVRLKVHRRARRVSLRLDRVNREIIATAPSPRRLGEAVAFARQREGWIAARWAELPQGWPIGPGVTFEVFGAPVSLELGFGRARWVEAEGEAPARICAMGDGEGFARAVARQVKLKALAVFEARTAAHAAALGAPAPAVAVGDPRSRWGSCVPAGRDRPASIRYSWRLALAPFATADYVAAHECAHLLEPNHGPRFWAHVKALGFDPRPHRAWLREHGPQLHAFGSETG